MIAVLLLVTSTANAGTKWAYVNGQAQEMATKLNITKPVSVHLASSSTMIQGMSNLRDDGYRVIFGIDWLVKSDYSIIREVVAHEMCHLANGDAEAFAKLTESRRHQVNEFDSPEHMRVYLCVVDLIGADYLDRWIISIGFDIGQRMRFISDLDDFRFGRGRWRKGP